MCKKKRGFIGLCCALPAIVDGLSVRGWGLLMRWERGAVAKGAVW